MVAEAAGARSARVIRVRWQDRVTRQQEIAVLYSRSVNTRTCA